jgi:hypothetical protein
MRKRCAALCAAALLHVVPAIAQEMNYTPFQLGARSALMGGAAVGGVRDSSATFYNPGALGFVTDPSLSVSANAFRYGQLKIYSALGSGQDATADLFDVVPLLVSGSAKLDWGHDWSVGYAILTRQQFNASLRGVVDNQRDASGFITGIEDFSGQFDDSRQVNEVWGMLAASWRVHDKLSIGGGPILAFRRQEVSQRFSTVVDNTLTLTNPIDIGTDTTDQVYDATFFQFSLQARLGIAWEPIEGLKVGATVTTPTLKLFGSGEVLARSTVTAFRFAQSAVLTGSSFQQDLGTNYRTPVSAALGIEYQVTPNWALGVSVEYFGGLSQRSVIDVDTNQAFFRQVPASIVDTRSLRLLDEREPVVNVSAGTEYRLTSMYAAYAGFWTDFSPININTSKALLRSAEGFPLAFSSVDVYNVVVGLSRRTTSTLIGAGVVVSYGRGTAAGNLDFVGDTASPRGLRSDVIERDVSYFATSAFVSFTYFF